MWNKGTLRAAVATACACAAGSVMSAQAPKLDACSVLTRDEIKTLSGNHDPGAPSPGGTSRPEVTTLLLAADLSQGLRQSSSPT